MKRSVVLILAALTLFLGGCAARSPVVEPETETTVKEALSWSDLDFQQEALCYAQEFTIAQTQGYQKLTVGTDQTFLVVPEGAEVPERVPQDVTALRQPLQNIYVVSSASMDYFCKLDALDAVKLSSQKATSWYLPQARQAMEEGKILYAGKYSAPDYETILAFGCDLAVENAMIYHTPEVMEQIQRLGIPVLVDRSSYEDHPLGRMEWIKFYGALLNRQGEAQAYYDSLLTSLTPILDEADTGKTVAFFYITASGAVNVRKGTDYITKSIALAGCDSVLFAEDEDTGANASQTIQMEAFYNGAVDADILIYNSTVDGELDSLAALLTKAPLLKNFKAVKDGQVYCITKNFYQESLALGDFILDVNTVASGRDRTLYFLKQLH